METIVKRCVALIQEADGPLSINEVRQKLPKEARFKEKEKDGIAAALRALPSSEGVASWPDFRRQDRFWKRSLADTVRGALPELLVRVPMTATQAGGELKREIKKVSKRRLQEEARAQLRILKSESKVSQGGNYYFCTTAFLQKTPPALASTPASPFTVCVADAVEEMETARGNYVSVVDLRNSLTFRRAIDAAILRGVREAGLVLARYDGPVPRPGERPDLLDAGNGEFFVGVARARERGAA